jgi:hypothetical protein
MKIEVTKKVSVEVTTLNVKAGVRYWEDSIVNGEEDTDGKLIPCRDGDYWCPIIDIETGVIKNWQQGTTAEIHYKVCDDGIYTLHDESGNDNEVARKEGYVPDFLNTKEVGDGDYIVMDIDENGQIQDWDNSDIGDIADEEE